MYHSASRAQKRTIEERGRLFANPDRRYSRVRPVTGEIVMREKGDEGYRYRLINREGVIGLPISAVWMADRIDPEMRLDYKWRA